MDRRTWGRIAALLATLVLMISMASCGSNATSKRVAANQSPCDLIEFDDLKKEFDPPDQAPTQVASLCSYLFKNASVKIELASEVEHDGDPIEIDGVTAMKTPAYGVCYIDMWLVPGDQSQHITVHFFRREIGATEVPGPDCDAGIMVARMILNGLPEGG